MTTPLEKYRLRHSLSYEVLSARIWQFFPQEAGLRSYPGRSLVAKWAKGEGQPSLEWALAIQRLCGRSVPLSSLLVRR